jgi:curved DNA-binding protein CbpA
MTINYKIAIELLELDDDFTQKELRKAYFKKCLMYHPDKNPHGKQMFRKVQESYEYLLNNCKNSINKSKNEKMNSFVGNTYSEIFRNYIYSIKPDFFNTDDIEKIIQIVSKITQTIINNSDDVAIKIIDKLDEDTCNKVYQFISNYKNIFNLSPEFLIKMRESINKRFETLPTIILKPEIKDLLNSNIFIYENEGGINDKNISENIKYYIPLWHEELHFKYHIVHIHPNLPEYINLDSDNNIIVSHRIHSSELITKENIEIYIQDKLYIIHRSDIKLIEYQKITIKNSGMPLINEKDIYDVSKKSNIIVELYIEF